MFSKQSSDIDFDNYIGTHIDMTFHCEFVRTKSYFSLEITEDSHFFFAIEQHITAAV